MKYTLKELTKAMDIMNLYQVNQFGGKRLADEIRLRQKIEDVEVGDTIITDNGDFTIITIDIGYKDKDFEKYGAMYGNELQVMEDSIEGVVIEILEDVGERKFEINKLTSVDNK